MAQVLPKHARVAVIGGGIIGTSVAYHLAKYGCKDVVLLERDKLTSGTTWHAAGLMVTYGSTSETSTELRKYTKQLYQDLLHETGQDTGFKPCGFIELASTKDHLEEFRRVSAFNRLCGVDVLEIEPREIQKMFPLCETEGLLAGFYVPTDGRVNPVDATMALAKGARLHGAKLIEGVTVENVIKKGKFVCGVKTTAGDIACDYVVNCAGMWARQFGARAGVSIPLQAAEHYYLLTEKVEGISSSWPVIEDPARYGYYREEGGGMLVGLFEPVCAPWKVQGIPNDSSFTVIQPDWERVGPYLDTALSRVPGMKNVGMKQLFCGPESFTPDLAPCVGEAPELRNYFVAAGLNSIGILTGGGIGRTIARWILDGKPDVDVTYMNVDRLQPHQANPAYLEQRTVESLGQVYACHYPFKSMKTARNVRRSAIHERLATERAYFKEVSGWEGADWYAPPGVEPKNDKLSWGKHPWFPYWAKEHDAARNGVILMDMSFMCKFRVVGKDAGKTLNYISANNVDDKANTITYTQWLNDSGRIEADLTVTKLAEDDFFVVATDTALRHVQAHFARHSPDHVSMVDITSSMCQVNIQGPKSRELLQKVTSVDLSNDAFPFRHAATIDIGFARVLCIRVTYVGELGYELYIPSDQALHVYDTINAVGKEVGLVHAGLKALASCRMEKGYRDFGHDLDNTDHILDTGLGMFVDLKKPDGFVGKDAVLKHKEDGKQFLQRIIQVRCTNPDVCMFHAEPVYRNGKPVGYVRAASYGHTLGGAVGLACVSHGDGVTKVDPKYVSSGVWEVDVAGTRYPAIASTAPMYDPKSERVRM